MYFESWRHDGLVFFYFFEVYFIIEEPQSLKYDNKLIQSWKCLVYLVASSSTQKKSPVGVL